MKTKNKNFKIIVLNTSEVPKILSDTSCFYDVVELIKSNNEYQECETTNSFSVISEKDNVILLADSRNIHPITEDYIESLHLGKKKTILKKLKKHSKNINKLINRYEREISLG